MIAYLLFYDIHNITIIYKIRLGRFSGCPASSAICSRQ